MLNIHLTYGPAVAFLKKQKLCSRKNLYMNINSSSIHKSLCCQKWNKPNILQHVNGKTNCGTMKYHPIIKRNELVIHSTT